MRKLFHLAIACCTFAVSVFVTNIWTSLSRADVVSECNLTVSPVEAGLLEIYRDYASAQTSHHRAFFERVEADDFILFAPHSKPLSRSEDVQLLNSLSTDIVYKIDDLKVQIYGDGAIVTGRMTASHNGGYKHSWRWIDICVKRGGRWQIQSTTQVD